VKRTKESVKQREPVRFTHPTTMPKIVGRSGRAALLARQPWLTFILPLVVYMLVGSLEPTQQKPGGEAIGLAIAYPYYPLVYTLKLALTVVAMALVWPGYRQFPPRVVLLSLVVGVFGAVLWIMLAGLGLEQRYLVPLLSKVRLEGLISSGVRSAYNPLAELGEHPAWAWGFLLIRFFGLVLVVPVIEEFFYRGFLMRFPVRHDWWNVPQGTTNKVGAALAILLPMAMHPAELLAAAVWFAMIAWLYVKTRSIWDCVAAHAVTNLLMGIYVVAYGQWQLM
jgi:uncharacterized protein